MEDVGRNIVLDLTWGLMTFPEERHTYPHIGEQVVIQFLSIGMDIGINPHESQTMPVRAYLIVHSILI